MIGYDAIKEKERIEAWRDRQASRTDCAPEIRRLAFVAKVRKAFPYLDVQWIADHLDPWDQNEFKRQVSEAQERYLESRYDE
jgi:hypothetical protein